MKSTRDLTENTYLQDLQEFQANKDVPGYYSAGNMPPYIKHPTRFLGWCLLLISSPALFVMGVNLVQEGFAATFQSGVWVPSILSLLTLVAGLSVLLRKRPKK